MQLKTVSNFKATANFFNFLTLKKEKKSCNKSVNFILIILFDDLITTYFPFLRDISPKNRMLCLRNAYETFKTFSRFYSLYLETYNWLVLFIHETFLVYKLETFKNPQASPEKIHSPFFTHSPHSPKSSKSASPSFCQHWKFFRSPMQKGGEDTMHSNSFLSNRQCNSVYLL